MIWTPKAPTSADPVSATRPLIFEYSDGDNTLYGVSGTGFLLIVDETIVFMTARHAIGDGHNLLRVPVTMGNRVLVPLKVRHDAVAHTADEIIPIDVTFFTLDPASPQEESMLRREAIQALRYSSIETFLEKWREQGLALDGVALCAYGYPKAAQDVIPDLIARPRLGKMRFRGLSPVDGSYEATWNVVQMPDPDGMSGSPVFIRGRSMYGGDHVFVGMLTNASNGLAHFISGGLLVSLVRDALSGQPALVSK